ncbi:MAG: ABC transporter permease [Clostridiales Family XIII bacterium]|jgi:ribose transport system permease protein|nr:ABC transporter permease [Clostridiales Family XIII bacterium]
MSVSDYFKKYAIFLVLIVMIIVFAVLSPLFFTPSNGMMIARQVSFMGIASVGMMFVMLTGGIDLSIGSALSFINVVGAYFMVKMEMPILPACLLCLAISSGFGFVQGVIITKLRVPPLIATLAFMTMLSGLAFIISGGMPIYGFDKAFNVLGQGYVGPVPIPVLVMVAVLAVGAFILNKTYFGRYFYAIGGNEEAAMLSGINVDWTKQLVYTISGFCAGLAGIIMLSRLNSGQPTTGSGFEFEVITACVLGGVSVAGGSGKMFGVVVGVLMMGVLSNGLLIVNVKEYAQQVVMGIVLTVAVSFDCMSKYRMERKNKEIKAQEGGAL